MITLREAAQQALEAMDKATRYMSDSDYMKLNQAIDDLKVALEQPERRTGPPSCERSCEANAFQIEIRRLKAELERNQSVSEGSGPSLAGEGSNPGPVSEPSTPTTAMKGHAL